MSAINITGMKSGRGLLYYYNIAPTPAPPMLHAMHSWGLSFYERNSIYTDSRERVGDWAYYVVQQIFGGKGFLYSHIFRADGGGGASYGGKEHIIGKCSLMMWNLEMALFQHNVTYVTPQPPEFIKLLTILNIYIHMYRQLNLPLFLNERSYTWTQCILSIFFLR